MNLSDSVILPREDFIELQTVAWNQPPQSASERIASITHTTTIVAVLTVAWGAGCWAWYKAMAKLEDKKLANSLTELEEQDRLRTRK